MCSNTSIHTITMNSFVHALVCAAEKSASIARTIRQEEELFTLLVEEKKDEEKNKRFVQDFKTLADVLIQETVSYDVGKQFPEIAPHIKGEESNQFTNTLGETVVVEVKPTVEETTELLAKVLDGNMGAARLLATAVHQNVEVEMDDNLRTLKSDTAIGNLGIWIDPIDSTAEYISGKGNNAAESGIYPSGLQCVTVLIGAFDRSSGLPVLGVVNQPFNQLDSESGKWTGRQFWGVCHGGVRATSITGNDNISLRAADQRKVIVISTSESDKLKAALEANWNLVFAAGAGYKQLCVAIGLADAYILSKGSTFKWDSCAPHAVLRAFGGGIVSYQKVMTTELQGFVEGKKPIHGLELLYHVPDKVHSTGVNQWCNDGGIIAFKDVAILKDLISALKPETITAL